jgi:hypothetical protein
MLLFREWQQEVKRKLSTESALAFSQQRQTDGRNPAEHQLCSGNPTKYYSLVIKIVFLLVVA